MKPLANLALLLTIVVFAASCRIGRPLPPPEPAKTGGPEPVATVGTNAFLYTGYEPLERWMEERFKVRYENMPLDMVFDQQPISDIRYQYINLPADAPVFQLISPSISRREILQEVSRFYNVDMHVHMVDGKPSYVVVQGRGPGGVSLAPGQPKPNSTPAPAPAPAGPAPVPNATAPTPAPAGPVAVPGPTPPAPESTTVPIGEATTEEL